MRHLALALVLLFGDGTASAEFTPAEKAEMHKLWSAQHDFERAVYNLERAVWSGESAGMNETAITRLSYGGAELWYTIAILANDDILYPNYHYETREEFVATAMARLGGAINQISQALAALPDPCHYCGLGGDEGYSAWRIQEGLTKLQSFDQTLGYLDFAPVTSQGFPRQFGPHGEWTKAQPALSDPMIGLWQNLDDALLSVPTHTQQYGIGWRFKQAMERITDAYFAAWGHGEFGPDEASMRARVAEENVLAAGFDMETLVGFYEILKIHRQSGERGATHHFPYFVSLVLGCTGSPAHCDPPSAWQAETAANLSRHWRILDGWVHHFTNFYLFPNPPPPPPVDPICAADIDGDGVVAGSDLSAVLAYFGGVCSE